VASALSHAVAALGIGACFYQRDIPKRVWFIGAACSVIPDLDVIGFRFGIRYGDFWGHRGFTHSLIFAALLASVLVGMAFCRGVRGMRRISMWLFFFLATSSHGLLDAMTDGGLGVAFFAPFNNHRYFFPWRPIKVSPIAVTRFFTARGLIVLKSELIWIWCPAIVMVLAAVAFRRQRDLPSPD
jgi:inner membrane protein